MNFIKRALRAVSRRKVKSLLMLVIFFVIANLIVSGFAIREATNAAKVAAQQDIGAVLTLSFNTAKAMEKAMATRQPNPGTDPSAGNRFVQRIPMEPVTEEMAQKVASLEHILAYNYITNASASAEDFDPVKEEDPEDETDVKNPDGNRPNNGNRPIMNFTMPDVTLVGVYSSQLYFDQNSSYKLEDGDHILYSDQKGDTIPVLIETNLAQFNELSVGDTITIGALTSNSEDEDSDKDEEAVTYTLKIAGIYSAETSTSSQGLPGGFSMSFGQIYNQIIIDYKTALDISENSSGFSIGSLGSRSGGISSVVYYLDNPRNIDTVLAASKSLDIDWDQYLLSYGDKAYENQVKQLDGIASFSTTLMIVVIAAGVIILALILAMWIRERMYETGVLLSLGEGKTRVAMQYISEVLVVALIAFGLSSVSGSFISQFVGNYIVENQPSSTSQSPGEGPTMIRNGGIGGRDFGFVGNQAGVASNSVESLDVTVGLTTILKLFGIGILIVLAATLIPTFLVMRYKPKDILVRAG